MGSLCTIRSTSGCSAITFAAVGLLATLPAGCGFGESAPTGQQHRSPARHVWTAAENLASRARAGAADGTEIQAPRAIERSRPNIIFILVDDLGKDLLPLYDTELDITTPNIDRLAAEGVVFDNVYASPLCLPTRVELFSGQYPFNNGVATNTPRRQIINPKYVPSFPRLLREAGYATVMGGKWHGFRRAGQALRTFGFDEWMVTPWGVAISDTQVFTHEGVVRRRANEFSPDLIADFLTGSLQHHGERPFFLYYAMNLVHPPLAATRLRPGATSDADKLAAMTEYVDHLVGRFTSTLDELGLRDETIVFFAGDNGSVPVRAGDDDERFVTGGKGTLREAGINVPFIVSGGPVVRRGRTTLLADFTDMLPTLVELAGAEAPSGHRLDGHSLAPWLLDEAATPPRRWIAAAMARRPTIEVEGRIRWNSDRLTIAIRDQEFKLLEQRDGDHTEYGLFDLRRDPSEQVNLWDSAGPETVAAQRALLAVRDTLPPGIAPVRYDPLDTRLFSHWPLDAPAAGSRDLVFSDLAGGYDAHASVAAGNDRAGKFGAALPAVAGPAEAAYFGDFFEPRLAAFAPWNTGAGDRRLEDTGFTLSAWIKLEDRARGDFHLLRYPRAGSGSDLLDWRVSEDGGLVLELDVGQEVADLRADTRRSSIRPESGWTHVAAVWEGGSRVPAGWRAALAHYFTSVWRDSDPTCGAARLYVDGRIAAESCLGRELASAPAADLLLGDWQARGGPGRPPATWLDDVAIWRRALAKAEVAALHALGERFDYDASAVDTLFNTPADRASHVGETTWRRIRSNRWAQADGLVVEASASGAIELHFGNMLALRSDTAVRRPVSSVNSE